MSAPLLPPDTTIRMNAGADFTADESVVTIADAFARRKGDNFLTVRNPASDGQMLIARGLCTIRLRDGVWHASLRNVADVVQAEATRKEGKHVAFARLVALVADRTRAIDEAKAPRTFVIKLDSGYGDVRTTATEQHRRVPDVVEFLARYGWMPTKAAPPFRLGSGRWVHPTPYRKPDGMTAIIEETSARLGERHIATVVVEPIKTAIEGEAA